MTDLASPSPQPNANLMTATGTPIALHSVQPSLRKALSDATREVHNRLHLHAGFAAVATGDIDTAGYRHLLARLYGFHLAFEDRLDLDARQSALLADDLAALGMDLQTIAQLPRCAALPRTETRARLLGARYVTEGAALGGRVLARGLDRLLGAETRNGRRFFSGDGQETGARWQAFLKDLERCGRDDTAFADAVSAAQDMFAAFEAWLNGWEHPGDAQH